MPSIQAAPPEKADPKEFKIPATLVGISVLIVLTYALITGGAHGLMVTLIRLPIEMVVQVAMGVVACLITMKIMGCTFGYLSTAIIKLAAIFIFPHAVTFFIPITIVGWLISLALYWGLIEWLFELNPQETVVMVIVIWVVNMLAILLVASLTLALH